MQRKNALDTRGGETRGEGEQAAAVAAPPTKTTQPIATKSPNGKAKGRKHLTTYESWCAAQDIEPVNTPAQVLVTDEQQAAFCQAVVDDLGIKPACKKRGLRSSAVFYWANTHPDFREKLKAAQAAEAEDHAYRIKERNERLLAMPPAEMNLCANAYRIAGEQDMRMLGKLNARLYGDHQQAQVNVQTNVGLVCDEQTRARLIELNQKLLHNGSEKKQLEQ